MTAEILSWLIRDNTNVIRGPFAHNEVLQLIKKGQLKGKVEISQANSYWFAIEEQEELAKFFPELGLEVKEQQTQMTATLNQAEQSVDMTQFTSVPTTEIKIDEDLLSSASGQMQWLNEEVAMEFGEDETGSTQATQEMMQRASVKADTLPSEFKSAQGERPKPMDAVLKAPEKGASAYRQGQSNMVHIPLDRAESVPKMVHAGSETNEGGGKKKLIFALVAVGIAVFGLVEWMGAKPASVPLQTKSHLVNGDARTALEKSLLLYNLEGAKEALAEWEMNPLSKGQVALPIAVALIKKEFLFDTDGALLSLQTAKSLAKGNSLEPEVDNLMANYSFERDKSDSLAEFRRLFAAQPANQVFHYNLALALLRNGLAAEASRSAAAANVGKDPLVADFAILAGWAKEVASGGNDPSAEAAYAKALEHVPYSAKARLGLGIYHLRKGGMRASEADFRAFLDALPELDPPTQVTNFRKMADTEFYQFARAQLRELNVPLGAAGNKPSPLVMAVDAVLSCLQNRTGEAGKILEGALSAAPGDPHLLKAVGYHRWKEGRYQEIIDLLKEIPREKQGFAIGFLLAKSYGKVGRLEIAEKYLEALTASHPQRSDGWSLLGSVQLQRGKKDLAIKSLSKALEQDSFDLLALRGLDHLGQGKVLSPELARNLPF